jgi:hypothetical protein
MRWRKLTGIGGGFGLAGNEFHEAGAGSATRMPVWPENFLNQCSRE